MSLDRAVTILDILKPVAKTIPLVGNQLEGALEGLRQCCKLAEDVKTNKKESELLLLRAARCADLVVGKAKDLSNTGVSLNTRLSSSIDELTALANDIEVLLTQRKSARSLSRIWNKGRDRDEISELGKRFDQVLEQLGISAQLSVIGDLSIVSGEVNSISKTVSGAEERALLERLKPSPTARHDAAKAPKGCTAGTRVEDIQHIVDWCQDTSGGESVFWLSGLAGTGKTAIMKSVSVELAQLGVLGASFFISRAEPGRCESEVVIRSITYQLALSQPALRPLICQVLRDDPDIVDKSIAQQIPTLLTASLSSAVRYLDRPIIIVIDALDERNKNEDDDEMLPLIVALVRGSQAKVKLIVSSRPETGISRELNNPVVNHFELHRVDTGKVKEDIRLYLNTAFRDIARLREVQDSADWPSSQEIDDIVDRAGGLFIYAATVINYVNRGGDTPPRRLRAILERKPTDKNGSFHGNLDDLYSQIVDDALGPYPDEHQSIGR